MRRNYQKYLEYQRRYREEHREEIREKDRKRYNTPEGKAYRKQYNKEYCKKNEERLKELHKEYHKAHYVSMRKDLNAPPPYVVLFEQWKDINDNYMVSSQGRVWNKRYGRLAGTKNGSGYIIVTIDGTQYYVHRLVAEAFIPNTNNYREIDHINTDKADNRVENLRWTNRKGNINNPLTIEKMKRTRRERV